MTGSLRNTVIGFSNPVNANLSITTICFPASLNCHYFIKVPRTTWILGLRQGVGTPLHMICVAYIHSLDGIIIIEINLASSYVACTSSVGAIKDFIMFIYQVLWLLLHFFLFWVHKTHYTFNGGIISHFNDQLKALTSACHCMC